MSVKDSIPTTVRLPTYSLPPLLVDAERLTILHDEDNTGDYRTALDQRFVLWTQYTLDALHLDDTTRETYGDACWHCQDELVSGWMCADNTMMRVCNECAVSSVLLTDFSISQYKEVKLTAQYGDVVVDFGFFADVPEAQWFVQHNLDRHDVMLKGA